MRKLSLIVVAGAAVAGVGAWAMASTAQKEERISVQERFAEMMDARTESRYEARLSAQTAREAAVPDVGDADTFGRNVRWLGMVVTPPLEMRTSCELYPGEDPDRLCIVVNPGATTSNLVQYRDLARMTLPARSINSMLCHWITPTVSVNFSNVSGLENRTARLTLYPTLTVENEALNLPGLIDPATGEPLDGKLEIFVSTNWSTALLDSGESVRQRNNSTRTCIGGYLTKRVLMEGYGLSERQAGQFFANPTTIRVNADIWSNHVQNASVSYAIRFVGD